jgi:hypothetical protein
MTSFDASLRNLQEETCQGMGMVAFFWKHSIKRIASYS